MSNDKSQGPLLVKEHLAKTIKRFLIINVILLAIEIGTLIGIYFIIQSQLPAIK